MSGTAGTNGWGSPMMGNVYLGERWLIQDCPFADLKLVDTVIGVKKYAKLD
jgi:hypothetical protein